METFAQATPIKGSEDLLTTQVFRRPKPHDLFPLRDWESKATYNQDKKTAGTLSEKNAEAKQKVMQWKEHKRPNFHWLVGYIFDEIYSIKCLIGKN